MSARLFNTYSKLEDEVIIPEWHGQPFYARGVCDRMDADQVRCYLVQIGFIANNFVRWYETAKQAIGDEEGKEVIRTILRSEIPQKGPTHQDDRFADLLLARLSPQAILNTPPTGQTQETVDQLFRLIRYRDVARFDLSVLVTLRVAGEILVAEQYAHIIRHWTHTLHLQEEQSRFFVPHMVHDRKSGSRGHTGVFDKVLRRLICNKGALYAAMEAAYRAAAARASIHAQFVAADSTLMGMPGIQATPSMQITRMKRK